MALNMAASWRPAHCLKATLRQTRLQRASPRCWAAAISGPVLASTASVRGVFGGRQRDANERLKKFHIWPRVPAVTADYSNPMPALHQQLISQMDPTGARTRLVSRKHADSAKVGDVLMVTTKTGEPFSGAFIEVRRRGIDTAILLRGQMMKTGVEMWFKIYSPTVAGIDIVWRRPKRARRARLTYMRKPKHDMGSVDHLVAAWKKERHALRARARQSGSKEAKS